MKIQDAPLVTNIPSGDVDRSRNFYSEKLGLKLVEQPMPDSAAFECGDGTLLFIYLSKAGPAKHTLAAWLVDDVGAAVADLAGRGVAFECYDMPGFKTDTRGIAEMNGYDGAWFKDPDGNILSIVQRMM
jgi:catechol 2,3-dioxygenase-like lactoylglutathione lyase family enzyme